MMTSVFIILLKVLWTPYPQMVLLTGDPPWCLFWRELRYKDNTREQIECRVFSNCHLWSKSIMAVQNISWSSIESLYVFVFLLLTGERYSCVWFDFKLIIRKIFQEEHLNMLEGGIIAKLLDEKWSTYAQVSSKTLKNLVLKIHNI